MREWPSIVPAASEDFYIVVNSFGRHGTAFAETDLDRADHETTISDLMSGQHSDPQRVIMFNPATNRSEDVSHANRVGNPAAVRSGGRRRAVRAGRLH